MEYYLHLRKLYKIAPLILTLLSIGRGMYFIRHLNQKLRFVVILLICSLSLSCVSYRAHPISPSKNAHTLLERSLSDQGLHQFLIQNHKDTSVWPPHSWDVEGLALAAFYYHPDMELARAQKSSAQASIRTAKQRPNPTFSFTPERITNPSPGLSPWIHTFNLSVPIEIGGKRHFRLKQAQSLALSTEYKVATTAWKVRNRLELALLSLSSWKEKEELLQKRQVSLADYLGLLDQRIQSGMVSPLQITDSQLLLDQLRLNLADAQKQRHQALADVAAALGIPMASLENVHFNFDAFNHFPALKKNTFESFQILALTNRSDILAGVAQYDACQAALQLELAKRYPDINLGPGYQWSQGEKHWSLGFSLTLPLFNQNQGPIAEAKAHCEESAAQFNQLQASIVSDLDHAWIAYQDSLKNRQQAKDVLALQEKKLALLKNGKQGAEAVRNSLAAAELNVDTAHLLALDNQLNAQKALLDLENVMQRPLQLGNKIEK